MKDFLYDLYKSYKVKAKSLEDFLNRYYKSERFTERGNEYVQAVIASHKKDLNKYGYTIVSHHDNVTGKVVAYYKQTPQQMFEMIDQSKEK